MSTGTHWNEVYSSKAVDEVSWFQDPPGESLRLVLRHSSPTDSVVDIGAGASLLVDHLLDHGYRDVTAVDLSDAALETVRRRLALRNASITTHVADVTTWSPPRAYRVWHDRAVLHFLVTDEQRRAYVDTVSRALEPGGTIIIGAFAATGPTSCSGLPVQRHTLDSLSRMFSAIGTVIDSSDETHVTPWGAEQDFVWVVIRVPAAPVGPRPEARRRR